MVVRNVYRLFFLRPALIETGAGLKVGATLLTSSFLLFLYLLSSSPLLPFLRLYFFLFFTISSLLFRFVYRPMIVSHGKGSEMERFIRKMVKCK